MTAGHAVEDPPDRPARSRPVSVDVSTLPGAGDGGGLAAIAALARLRLAARRTGYRVRLTGAGPALRALLEQSGLAGEFEWEPEEGEEPPGVQE